MTNHTSRGLRAASSPSRQRRVGDHRIGRHKTAVCRTTGLARYGDREQAQDAVRGLRWRDAAASADGRLLVDRWYSHPCECGGWHVLRLPAPTSVVEQAPPAAGRRAMPAIHVADIENWFRGGGIDHADARSILEAYRREGPGVAPGDLVVIAASLRTAKRFASVVREVFAGTRLQWAVGSNGPDGADRALLRTVNTRRHAKKYGVLYLGSGDHIFAPLVREARGFGLKVRIVTTQLAPDHAPLSRELAATGAPRVTIRANSRSQQQRAHEAIRRVAAGSLRNDTLPFAA